ncbi:MAG: cytochrome c oxidase subunit II [Verrucomicrobia bacterium]|nr:cytochrome c oxidase subunit II [Verrucomicrobiota bacterium]
MRLTTLLPTFARWGRAALAIGGLALLPGCDLNFWRMDGHQSTMVVDGPVAHSQLGVFMVTVWVTLAIFIIVGAVLAYATWKFRAKSEADEHAEPPPQSHGNPLVEIGLIAASIFALVIIAVPTLKAIWYTYDVPGGATRPELDAMIKKGDAYEVNATGLQWWFKFEYPLEQINGTGTLVTANELVIPAGRPVRINLRTMDVIHSFWIPKLAGKVDMIPNRANHLWVQAEKAGYFYGQCAEYCGDSHAVMRFRVIALEKKEFAEWLEAQKIPARNVAPKPAAVAPAAQFAALRTFKQNEYGFSAKYDAEVSPQGLLKVWTEKQDPEKGEDAALIEKGKGLFKSKACMGCHTVRGHDAPGMTAPDLTHVGSRTSIAGGLLENNNEQLRRWIKDPTAVKPGNKMGLAYARTDHDGKALDGIKLTLDEEVALAAYLQSLK